MQPFPSNSSHSLMRAAAKWAEPVCAKAVQSCVWEGQSSLCMLWVEKCRLSIRSLVIGDTMKPYYYLQAQGWVNELQAGDHWCFYWWGNRSERTAMTCPRSYWEAEPDVELRSTHPNSSSAAIACLFFFSLKRSQSFPLICKTLQKTAENKNLSSRTVQFQGRETHWNKQASLGILMAPGNLMLPAYSFPPPGLRWPFSLLFCISIPTFIPPQPWGLHTV